MDKTFKELRHIPRSEPQKQETYLKLSKQKTPVNYLHFSASVGALAIIVLLAFTSLQSANPHYFVNGRHTDSTFVVYWEQYTGFFVMLSIILAIVIFNRSMFWWVKAIIIAYYSIVSYIFITVKNDIDRKYDGILPVPDAYWDNNSGWVATISSYLFWPLLFIVIYLYYRWFKNVKSRTAKIFVTFSILPAVLVYLFFAFMFGFAYGYRP